MNAKKVLEISNNKHTHTNDIRDSLANHQVRCLECGELFIPVPLNIVIEKTNIQFLCDYMNELAAKVRTGVRHVVIDGRIQFSRLGDNGVVIEQGLL